MFSILNKSLPVTAGFLAFLLIGVPGVQSENLPSGPGVGARICFPEPTFDFGTVTVGATVKHVFTFTNTGNQVLEIRDVKSTCGCTAAGQWSRRVEPGQAGTVPVEFHTGAFNGPVVKPVTILCNDTNQADLTIQLKGIVWHPIDVIPVSAAFSGALETPASLMRTIYITNREDKPLTLGSPKSNHHSIAAEVVTNESGKAYQITVRLVPPLGAGNVFGEVSVPTSSTNMPVLSIPVWAVAQPAVMVLPKQVEMPAGPLTNQITRSVSVRNNASTALELFEPALNLPGVDAKLYELQKGQFFQVLLTFPKGFQKPSNQPMELSFKSNNPKFPVLKVPIVEH
ncbi:MAG TPA: DUF1573 domain-containing protein [Verrucomicrobiae bacterium]|nr:DUF1573 domain-containing protein [Verrucomicrobiae bacterium]